MNEQERARIFRRNIETDDCSIIAAMHVLDVPYAEALKIVGDRYRDHGTAMGTQRSDLWEAVEEFGATLEDVEIGFNETVATFSLSHPSGRFLVHIEKHVMACVEGEISNSKGHWNRPVERIKRVRLPEAKARSRSKPRQQRSRGRRRNA
jgi:hypothetical protein